jgi:hypothetical protein
MASKVSFCKGNPRSGCAKARGHASKDVDPTRTIYRVFLDRNYGHLPLDQSECGSFVTKTHIDQRQIANQLIVFWLLDFTEP